MSTLQTLDRGLQALDIVSRSPQGISVAELAKELDVARAICYRIVATLEAHSLVARFDDGRIRMGVGVAVLASRFAPQFLASAGPVLEALARETNATAHLSRAEADECVVIMVAEPEGTLMHVGYRVGNRHPLLKGAAGLAILAARPENADDPDVVRRARQLGYSMTRGQLESGAMGIAVGIQSALAAQPSLGLECSIGVVTLGDVDVDAVAAAVKDASSQLRQLLMPR
ncbi:MULTISPECIES: IclR family transcriptional regulator [unclassified Mycolicibacterium]|uniref:IclR family transcriptional regulator n=1 Tax=unclassified Mycolicibacterium TaxID=2636767 RepID=UPI002EDAA299